jgi:hypothetical protein
MGRSFQVPLKGDPDALASRAEQLARQVDAEFTGDGKAGCFAAGGVEGQYEVQGENVTVTISKKPLVAPWWLVEEKVRSFFV